MNDYEREHNKIMRRLGAECAVLLKSDGSFPLEKPCALALCGSGARHTIKGGTGSGEVNSRTFVTVEEGLEAAGFMLTGKHWLDAYDMLYPAARREWIRSLKAQAREHHTVAVMESMGAVMPEPEYNIPLPASGEAAVYVLSRISGEGSDRRAVPGDILLLSQLGVETGSILADLILGKASPSGKLTTTWSAWEDYPGLGSFGEKDDTLYQEGVYVGYRYFDTVGKKPLFPFGFGLSYTDFSLAALDASEHSGIVTVRAAVKNVGGFAGKEVAQLYVSAPQGKLDKPYQSLAAFAKTRELQPGESEELTLTFDLCELASYDEARAAWTLEAGDYVLRLGDSSADTQPVAVVRLDGETVVRQVKNCLGKPDFKDWKPESLRTETLGELPVLAVAATAFETETVDYARAEEIDPLIKALGDEELCLLNIGAFDPKGGAMSVIGNASQSVAGAAGETTSVLKDKGVPALVMADGPAGLRLSREYTRDEKGAHSVGDTMPESLMELMPAPVAFAMKLFASKGKVKGEILEQYCTAIPIGTALAQSWNLDFAERCGDVVGDEMERFGVHLWLAPALNIHRDIRCGRNYEYFSEDPLISGRFAAAITRGVQKHPGCGTTIKHFAANNQETNRYNSNSAVSERAMREIYLRGFGLAVKEGQPHALMTSYNLLNGTHSSERRDLIEDVLRCEFGFEGIVMTDWIIAVMSGKGNKYPAPNAAKIAAAGNDLTMPGGKGDLKAMLKGLKDGLVTRRQLEINATRVYRMAKKLTEG